MGSRKGSRVLEHLKKGAIRIEDNFLYVTDNEYKGTERKEKPFIFDQIFDKKDSNSQAFFFFFK